MSNTDITAVGIGIEGAFSLYGRFVNPLWADALSDLGLAREFVAGRKAYLIDEVGNEFLDMIGGFGSAVLGYGHPYLVEAISCAVRDSAPAIVPWGISPDTGRLASRLCQLCGRGLEKVYFASGGAEAVDTALKFAAGVTGRCEFVSLSGGFHGLTVTTTGLSGGIWARPFPEIWPRVTHVSPDDLDAIGEVLSQGRVAALVLEAIQGSAGAAPLGPELLLELGRLAKKHGTLVIVDEVMTGIGRTGDWFGVSGVDAKFQPDMLILSKGLTGGLIPVSAVLMRDEVFSAIFADRGRAKIHGSTFSGSRIAMACGNAVLDVIERDKLLDQVRKQGALFAERFRQLRMRGSIANAYGRGLFWGVEIIGVPELKERSSSAAAICIGLLERGIFTSVSGHDPGIIRLSPPFVIEESDVNLFFDAFEECLDEMKV
jgi:ornithine--oxo-acid transaminase